MPNKTLGLRVFGLNIHILEANLACGLYLLGCEEMARIAPLVGRFRIRANFNGISSVCFS